MRRQRLPRVLSRLALRSIGLVRNRSGNESGNRERPDERRQSSLEQAETNAGKHIPLLVFKRNRSKIYATIEFERLLELLDEDSKSTQ